MNLNVKLILILFVAYCISGCQTEGEMTKKQPNIIFLVADDQRADVFGFMGNDNILTPHLDKLAADGVNFDNAYHVAPICQPS
ncbi:MAG: sulfatase-like hydrolase/transferase, partial [Balneolaceae bacterium]